MNQRKGQAAMEFLMTYGWAILAAIIAVGVLAYFGVFNPGNLASDAGVLSQPFVMDDFNIQSDAIEGTNDGFQMVITQNGGDGIDLNSISVTLPDGTACTSNITSATDYLAGNSWPTGTQATMYSNCGNSWASGDTVRADIAISYNVTGGSLTHQSTGNIRGVSQ